MVAQLYMASYPPILPQVLLELFEVGNTIIDLCAVGILTLAVDKLISHEICPQQVTTFVSITEDYIYLLTHHWVPISNVEFVLH